jgi:hypothetical protein
LTPDGRYATLRDVGQRDIDHAAIIGPGQMRAHMSGRFRRRLCVGNQSPEEICMKMRSALERKRASLSAFNWLFSLTICVALLASSPSQQAVAQGIEAAVTIGTLLNGLSSLVSQLQASASQLLAQGNNDLAQQQLLLAGTLSQLIKQTQDAYADALNKTADQLNTAELNVRKTLIDETNLVADIESKTAKDAQSVVYQTQGAVNQMLDKLPLVKKVPVFYGVVAYDAVSALDPVPWDLQILGFRMSDDALKFKKPVVRVNNTVIPDSQVSVQQDRVQILLPDALKSASGLKAGACAARKPMSVSIDVFYNVNKGFWIVPWNSEQETTFNANTIVGQDRFDVTLLIDGIRTTHAQQTNSFSTKPKYSSVGCGQSQSDGDSFVLPPDATQINCRGQWVDTAAIHNQAVGICTAGGPGGTTVTVNGTYSGQDKQCALGLCNCPGGGHASLQMVGTYVTKTTSKNSFQGIVVGHYLMTNVLNASLTADALKATVQAAPAQQAAHAQQPPQIRVPGFAGFDLKKILDAINPAEQLISGILAASGSAVTGETQLDSTRTIKRVTIKIARKDCNSQLDEIDVQLADNPLQAVDQTSNNGYFKANLQNGQLTVTKVSP